MAAETYGMFLPPLRFQDGEHPRRVPVLLVHTRVKIRELSKLGTMHYGIFL